MFTEKIKELQAFISAQKEIIATKTAEVKNALEGDDLETAKAIKSEVTEAKKALTEAEEKLALFVGAEEEGGAEKEKGEPVKTENVTHRQAINDFLRSKGMIKNELLNFATQDEILVPMNEITPTSDGVKRDGTKPITSEEIVTTPIREVKTQYDLKQFSTIHKASKGAGKYPILRAATSKMVSVAELEKNPALAKPEFDNVAWEVQTYRGAIPVSQESIDDADVDLLAIVAENANQIKVNTTNAAIASVMKSFEAKTVTNLDDIKGILNVDLDPAYNVSFVVSQSFYNILDTLKDGNGRYLLQDSITSASGKVFAGLPVFVIADDLLGSKGDAVGFVGDVNRGILYVDRAELGLRWADNEIYGQYLQAVVRFDVKQADAKAGYFVTFTP